MLLVYNQWSGKKIESGARGSGIVIYAVKMCLAGGLTLKKKLLPVMIASVVI